MIDKPKLILGQHLRAHLEPLLNTKFYGPVATSLRAVAAVVAWMTFLKPARPRQATAENIPDIGGVRWCLPALGAAHRTGS